MITKADIKKEAARLFSEKGYEGTSVKDIGDAVGLKKQSLYSHFSNKSEIYIEILKDEAACILGELNKSILKYGGEPADKLLKEIFFTLAAIFSSRERLILWRRTVISYATTGDDEFKTNDDWKFDRKLAGDLRLILSSRYQKFKDNALFRTFFTTYMIFINGFLDVILKFGFNEDVMRTQWQQYWNCLKQYFA